MSEKELESSGAPENEEALEVTEPEIDEPKSTRDQLSEELWAAVRDKDSVLTGEEVALSSFSSDTEDIVGLPVKDTPVAEESAATEVPSVSAQAEAPGDVDEGDEAEADGAAEDLADTGSAVVDSAVADSAVADEALAADNAAPALDSSQADTAPLADTSTAADNSQAVVDSAPAVDARPTAESDLTVESAPAAEEAPVTRATTIPEMVTDPQAGAQPQTSTDAEAEAEAEADTGSVLDLDEPEDSEPSVADVMRNREDAPVDDTSSQRRSFVAPAPVDEDSLAETSWHPRSADSERVAPESTPDRLDDVLFDGASVIPEMPSRLGAHLWSFFLTLLLVPVAWFLASDAGVRMAVNPAGPAATGAISWVALAELASAIVLACVVVALALRSSLGAWVSGLLVIVCGLPWIVVPGLTAAAIAPAIAWLTNVHVVGANLAYHLQMSGFSGQMLLFGLALLMLGIVSHSVRRRGRKEEAMRAEVELINPVGAHFTARARRKAEKAAGLR